MLTMLKDEMQQYYAAVRDPQSSVSQARNRIYQAVVQKSESFLAENPDIAPALLKSRVHDMIAEEFEPVIFPHCPFFYEMGMLAHYDWGAHMSSPSSWYCKTMEKKCADVNPLFSHLFRTFSRLYMGYDGLDAASMMSGFDHDHHTVGYTRLMHAGFNGLLAEIAESQKNFSPDCAEYTFLCAMEQSLNAMLAVAEKFARKAEEMIPNCADAKALENLTMIARAARNVPAHPPKTFYEGLAMLLFVREAMSVMEAIGVSQIGHVDRLLGPLYEKDIREGRLTADQAREMIGQWMLYTDIKFDLEHVAWPETSTCIQLGGCDEDGSVVCNDVTRLFLEVHRDLKLINPKLNCRFSQKSPMEYLRWISESLLAGDNNFALSNDDILIPGLMASGVDAITARRYVNGGCQETMIEGGGHTEGAYLYLCLPRFFELFLRPQQSSADFISPMKEIPADFETLYQAFLDSFEAGADLLVAQKQYAHRITWDARISPAFSATQNGCIPSGTDYSQGGSQYSFSTICLTGIGTITDSLHAIRTLVYEQKAVSLETMLAALAANWEGYADLRNTVLKLPKYGTNTAEVDQLARRLVQDISDRFAHKSNGHGGRLLISMFVYYYYRNFASTLGATADGRRAGDLINPGVSPSQLVEVRDPITPLHTIRQTNYAALRGGNAVLDVLFPMSSHLTPDILAAYLKTCGQYGCPTIQPNVLSVEQLKEAQREPDKHRGLIVRICGLSAYFVALEKHVQDEIIERNTYQI